MDTPSKKLRIDIVSDVVCPWCIIGFRQLATALETTGVPHEIHWQPFELNPDMPPEGQNLREHVAEKYGAWREKTRFGKKSMGIQRSTFIIDAEGVVRRMWKAVKVDGHDQQVVKALMEL